MRDFYSCFDGVPSTVGGWYGRGESRRKRRIVIGPERSACTSAARPPRRARRPETGLRRQPTASRPHHSRLHQRRRDRQRDLAARLEVHGRGVEPLRLAAAEPKSAAYANFATRAGGQTMPRTIPGCKLGRSERPAAAAESQRGSRHRDRRAARAVAQLERLDAITHEADVRERSPCRSVELAPACADLREGPFRPRGHGRRRSRFRSPRGSYAGHLHYRDMSRAEESSPLGGTTPDVRKTVSSPRGGVRLRPDYGKPTVDLEGLWL